MNIAYQVIGDGPVDLVYVAGWITNVEVMWEDPALAGFLRRLASFSRLITFDKRGVGLSDPVPPGQLHDLDVRIADLKAVMLAAGCENAVLIGHSEGGSSAIGLASRHPEMVSRLILLSAYAKRLRSDDYPWAPTAEQRTAESAAYLDEWANPQLVAEHYAPSRASDRDFIEWIGRWLRLSASPKAAAALNDASTHIDVTHLLPSIQVPTLLLYRLEDQDVRVEEGRFIARKIPDAKLVELHGADHFFYAGDTEPILDEIEEFVTGHRTAVVPERVLKTVLFTDIVRSTEIAASMGDKSWRQLIGRHHELIRRELKRWRGTEVVTTGDGFLATFDDPANAIRCASSIVEAVRQVDVEVRCGIHTGVVEVLGDDVTGLAVNIGARIAAIAGPSDIYVSRTVKDLLAGSGIEFDGRGTHTLKGVPEDWEVFAVK